MKTEKKFVVYINMASDTDWYTYVEIILRDLDYETWESARQMAGGYLRCDKIAMKTEDIAIDALDIVRWLAEDKMREYDYFF